MTRTLAQEAGSCGEGTPGEMLKTPPLSANFPLSKSQNTALVLSLLKGLGNFELRVAVTVTRRLILWNHHL